MKLMIATPAFSGKVDIPYAVSFASTVQLLGLHKIEVVPLIVSSGSLLVAERNRLVEAFWKSDCTHLLCIDSDLGWPAEAVLAMLNRNKDFVAGVYPARKSGEVEYLFRPVLNPDNTIVNENGLLKVEYIPAGFIMLSKGAIKKMREKHPDLYYKPKEELINSPKEAFCFFNTEVWQGEFWGEDYVFCRKALEAGIDIWVDPFIQFDHAGTVGMLIEHLTSQQHKG
jgi:hypothetical protein